MRSLRVSLAAAAMIALAQSLGGKVERSEPLSALIESKVSSKSGTRQTTRSTPFTATPPNEKARGKRSVRLLNVVCEAGNDFACSV